MGMMYSLIYSLVLLRSLNSNLNTNTGRRRRKGYAKGAKKYQGIAFENLELQRKLPASLDSFEFSFLRLLRNLCAFCVRKLFF
jgi:hypothetical protein